jgi:hypothetical protein
MKLGKKVTDFIRLEEGNIGRKAAVVTGALLASGVLGTVLTAKVAEAIPDCDPGETHVHDLPHVNTHQDHYDGHYNRCLPPD